MEKLSSMEDICPAKISLSPGETTHMVEALRYLAQCNQLRVAAP